MHFHNPNIYELFIECVKKISAPNLSWGVNKKGDLVCTENHTENQDISGRKHSVKQIMHDLHIKIMPNECAQEKSPDESSVKYTFSKKELLDQINTLNSKNRFMMRRLTEIAQKTDNIRQTRKL